MLVGIVPFSVLMMNIFRRVHIHTLKQNEALTQRTREMEALLRVGRAVESSLELDKIIPAALEAILEITTAEAAEVWLSDPQEGVVSLRYHKGHDAEAFQVMTRFRMGEGYPGIVAQSGQPILAHDLPNDPRFLRNSIKEAGFSTYYAIPLRRPEGGTNGVLAVAAQDPKALNNEDELRLLQLMVDHVSAAVENSRLHEEVRTLATIAERDRLAKEMHDGLAQVLGYVNTKAQAVKELLAVGQVDAATRHMNQLEEAARETYDDVREAILSLGGSGRKQSFMESLQT